MHTRFIFYRYFDCRSWDVAFWTILLLTSISLSSHNPQRYSAKGARIHTIHEYFDAIQDTDTSTALGLQTGRDSSSIKELSISASSSAKLAPSWPWFGASVVQCTAFSVFITAHIRKVTRTELCSEIKLSFIKAVIKHEAYDVAKHNSTLSQLIMLYTLNTNKYFR